MHSLTTHSTTPTSRLSAFCDRALEAGWLLGVTITPVFFNVYSSRVFEPDKLTTLRILSTVMAVLWLVRLFEEIMHKGARLRFSWRTPMVLPAMAMMTIYLISSVFSLVPYTSFVGSYQRLQGTYTLFGYLVLFFALVTSLRTRAQLARLITVLILNSLPISLYGIIQHNGLDPLPWAGDVTSRVASNMGNAIFVAAYLIMIVPLTATRIIQSFSDILSRETARLSDILRASGYIFIIAVQLLTIWYSQSRGPWLGLVAAAVLFPYLALIMLQRRALTEDATPRQSLDGHFERGRLRFRIARRRRRVGRAGRVGAQRQGGRLRRRRISGADLRRGMALLRRRAQRLALVVDRLGNGRTGGSSWDCC